MAYLPGFEHDIFISYVHDINQDGWVTRLHDDLQKELDGSVKGVKIWRDCELNSNTRFDDKIIKLSVEIERLILDLEKEVDSRRLAPYYKEYLEISCSAPAGE